jgi:hypothetical protein
LHQRRGTEQRNVKVSPPTKRYNIDFVFDGHDYKIVPASRAAARVFEYKSPNDATVQ